jgi:fructan beta-fructosidase
MTETVWLDHGSDFYAGVTWSNVPDDRRILLAWMSNWAYTLDVPTSPWRGAMTIPRSLTLRHTSAGLRLAQKPVEELSILREEPALGFSGGTFAAADLWLFRQGALNELLDAEMAFSEVFPTASFVINIHTGAAEVTAIAIETREGQLAIDRTHSGIKGFHPAFAASSRHVAPLRIANGIRQAYRHRISTNRGNSIALDVASLLRTSSIHERASSRQHWVQRL